MKQRTSGHDFLAKFLRRAVAAMCAALLALVDPALVAQPPPSQTEDQFSKISNDQLDSLVAPIALYPDPLLAQILAASTYPLEIIQLQQFLSRNPDLKDKALEDAVMQQDWDPSVQALAALPEVVKRFADDIKWTTDLGNAFLAQQSDVMDAVQRMRAKAQGQGNLKSNEQMKVETRVVESKQVIIIEQANPQVVYVPTYNPVVVYGPPVYPYPPIYYPPPGYYAAGMAISFGVGVAMGAFWSGGWGWGFGWGGNKYSTNITINNNNNFVRNTNVNRPSTLPAGGSGGNNWQHNPRHRGGAPYSSEATATKYGGTTRGSSQFARQESARQQQSRQLGGNQPGASNRPGAGGSQAGTRPGQGQLGGGQGGNRPGAGGGTGAQAGTRPSQGQPGGGQGGNRGNAGGTGAGNANRGGAGGAATSADRVGNRAVPPSTGGGGARGNAGGAFNGASGGETGSAARASSSRGASSLGGGRSGGGSRR